MIKKCVLALIGCTIVIGVFGFVALRDNPARPVIGEPRHTDNHGVILRYYISGPDDAEVVRNSGCEILAEYPDSLLIRCDEEQEEALRQTEIEMTGSETSQG